MQMEDHGDASFTNSCVKMPVDPYSRHPTPSYERPRSAVRILSPDKSNNTSKTDDNASNELPDANSPANVQDFLAFVNSIPDYGEIHHLSNEQFQQKLEYLKRKQTLLLTNLCAGLDAREDEANNQKKLDGEKSGKLKTRGNKKRSRKEKKQSRNKEKQCNIIDDSTLNLKGKRCNIESSRVNSPSPFAAGSFKDLTKDQDLLSYSYKSSNKTEKTLRNKEILSSGRSWSDGSDELKNNPCVENDYDFYTGSKSLPSRSPQKWHPTLPKPFTFTIRDDVEKYMSRIEEQLNKLTSHSLKKKRTKKRRARKIPTTSKLPLYDKLLAEKEERSRIVREKSAINLLSQVRPFKLECEQRAWRSLSRSSPDLSNRKICSSVKFKAKPVPKDLFNTDIYDKMLEDEYFRHLQKKMRALDLLRSSSLPPSMARRQKLESSLNSHDAVSKDSASEKSRRTRSLHTSSSSSDRPKSVMMSRLNNGTNLAAILRCQASREKLEQEIREALAERERLRNEKLRQALLARKPAWKALRIAARYDHERDLNYRTKLRRNEAREQAERHRLQMELMLDRVTRIPTLFERYSQNFQLYSQCIADLQRSKKETKMKKPGSSSTESYVSLRSSSTSSFMLNTASSTSSSGTATSLSNNSSNSSKSLKEPLFESTPKNGTVKQEKKRNDRGALKVSINENAELIEDKFDINCSITETQENNQVEIKNDEVKEDENK